MTTPANTRLQEVARPSAAGGMAKDPVWALGYNAAAGPVAAIGLLNPIIAAAAMALSSLSVIVNSALLKGARIDSTARTENRRG